MKRCVGKVMTFSIRVWEVVLIEEGLWESLEVDENSAWKDAIDLLHRRLDGSNKEKRSLK
jgi:hypothetical protein